MCLVHLVAFYQASGMPPVAFGVDLGKGESAEARRQLSGVAVGKLNSARRQIEEALPAALRVAGAPAGTIVVKWAAGPLDDTHRKVESVNRRVEVIVSALQGGLINAEEGRALAREMDPTMAHILQGDAPTPPQGGQVRSHRNDPEYSYYGP